MKTNLTVVGVVLLALAGCDVVESEPEDTGPKPLPPYPPGYEVARKIPEMVQAALPGDVVPAQVLIADDGCFYYHRGATTYPVTGADPNSRFCAPRDPVGQIINIPN